MVDYTIKDFLDIKSSICPSISPDGTKIIFLNDDGGTMQIYSVSIDCGKKEQLTNYEEPIKFCAFSPAENKILFGMDKDGNEKIQYFILDLDKKDTKAITEEGAHGEFGGWSKDGKYINYSSDIRNGTDTNSYIAEISTGNINCIFSEGGLNQPLGFSPDRKFSLVAKWHTSDNIDFYLIDLSNNKSKLITPHEGNAKYLAPVWLKDSSGFFFVSNQDRDLLELFFYEIGTNRIVQKFKSKYEVSSLNLNKDDSVLTISTNEDGYINTQFYDPKTLQPLRRPQINESLFAPQWSKDNKNIVFLVQDSTKPLNIWSYSAETKKAKQITDSRCNISLETFVKPELIKYKSFDGLEIPAFIYLPKNKKTAPVIINIHGGPEYQYTPDFAPLSQYLAYKGYVVIAPNVRGSTGYGKKYQSLDDREKRLDSVKDLEWLHNYIKQRKDVDSNKIALLGGSYGGYMVLAGLAFQPNLWAAGVCVCGISNLVTFLKNTSNYRRKLRESEYGYLDSQLEILEKLSPLNYIDKVKAPLLVIHGKNDPRVPLSEAEQITKKLKELNRDVHLIVYDDEGHGIFKQKNKIDAYPKIAEFLDKHLKSSAMKEL